MANQKEVDLDAVSGGIESEGFDYYMMNYGQTDLAGTPAWQAYQEYVLARGALVDALAEAGVDVDDL